MTEGTAAAAPLVAQIVISMDGAGKISVEGTIDNKLMAFGLLEIAKQSVIEFHKQKESRIVAPPPGSAAFLAGDGNPFKK